MRFVVIVASSEFFVAMHFHFNLLFSKAFRNHAGAVTWLSSCYRIPAIPIWLPIFCHIFIGYLAENALRWRMTSVKFGKNGADVICWRLLCGHKPSSRLLRISELLVWIYDLLHGLNCKRQSWTQNIGLTVNSATKNLVDLREQFDYFSCFPLNFEIRK
jgi:hypothetical protein